MIYIYIVIYIYILQPCELVRYSYVMVTWGCNIYIYLYIIVHWTNSHGCKIVDINSSPTDSRVFPAYVAQLAKF